MTLPTIRRWFWTRGTPTAATPRSRSRACWSCRRRWRRARRDDPRRRRGHDRQRRGRDRGHHGRRVHRRVDRQHHDEDHVDGGHDPRRGHIDRGRGANGASTSPSARRRVSRPTGPSSYASPGTIVVNTMNAGGAAGPRDAGTGHRGRRRGPVRERGGNRVAHCRGRWYARTDPDDAGVDITASSLVVSGVEPARPDQAGSAIETDVSSLDVEATSRRDPRQQRCRDGRTGHRPG